MCERKQMDKKGLSAFQKKLLWILHRKVSEIKEKKNGDVIRKSKTDWAALMEISPKTLSRKGIINFLVQNNILEKDEVASAGNWQIYKFVESEKSKKFIKTIKEQEDIYGEFLP